MTATDRTRRDAYARVLQAQLGDELWSVDELRVVQFVVDGLRHGRDVYGPLDLATDKRDLRNEARAEARDLIIYRACELLKALDSDRNIPLRRKSITVPPMPSGVSVTVTDALAAQQLAWRLAERSLFRPLYLEERAGAEWIDFGGEGGDA